MGKIQWFELLTSEMNKLLKRSQALTNKNTSDVKGGRLHNEWNRI